MIKNFIVHMRTIYVKSWDTKLRLIRVQDQSKHFWVDARVVIYEGMVFRSA